MTYHFYIDTSSETRNQPILGGIFNYFSSCGLFVYYNGAEFHATSKGSTFNFYHFRIDSDEGILFTAGSRYIGYQDDSDKPGVFTNLIAHVGGDERGSPHYFLSLGNNRRYNCLY